MLCATMCTGTCMSIKLCFKMTVIIVIYRYNILTYWVRLVMSGGHTWLKPKSLVYLKRPETMRKYYNIFYNSYAAIK